MSTGRSTASARGGLGARLRATAVSFLPPADTGYLALLLVPAALFDLTLGWLRVTSQYAAPTGWAAASQLRSDLLTHLGFAVLWLVAFAVLRSGWQRVVILVLAQTAVAAYLLFTVVANGYYRKTGSVLDAGGLRTIVEDTALTRALAASETSATHVWLMAGVVGYALLGPPLLFRLTTRGRSERGRWLPGLTRTRPPEPPARTGSRHRLALLGAATSFVLIVAAAVPTFTGAGAFSRNRVLDIALEFGAGAVEAERAAAERPARPPSHLVAAPRGDARAGAAQDRRPPRNVVVITMESLRWEATSLGNPARDTTPFLAELAERSLVAENAFTTVPHTSKAITGSQCGYMPPLDTKLTESAPGGLPATCLPGLLREQGYHTAFFQSAVGEFERRQALVDNLGYDQFFPVEDFPTAGFGRANYFGWEDDIMLEPSRDWIRAQGDAPFLLSYLTVTGHHDYRLPVTFPREHLSDEEDFDDYLNGARYVDRFVSRVFDLLSEEGHADDTLVVILADHGEGFGEHGLRQHDNTIYDEGIKVPYLVYDPSDRRGRTVERAVSTMSLPATVAEALGYRLTGGLPRDLSLFADDPTGAQSADDRGAGPASADPASADPASTDPESAGAASTDPESAGAASTDPESAGERLAAALSGGRSGQPIRVSCQSDNRCLAAIYGTTKYVHHFGNRSDEVFDLATDPMERHNLITGVDSDLRKRLRADLLRWRSDVRAEYAAHHSR